MNDEQENPETDPSEAVDLEARLALAQAEIADLKDKMLRAVAEAENVRRRAVKDVQDARNYGIAGFARTLAARSATYDLWAISTRHAATDEELHHLAFTYLPHFQPWAGPPPV